MEITFTRLNPDGARLKHGAHVDVMIIDSESAGKDDFDT